MATSPSIKLSDEETLATVEEMRQKRLASTKDFLVGFAKAATTDLPGFLMDVADKLAGDTKTFGEKDRSSQLFERMTGIKSKTGSGGAEEVLGSMISPTGAVGAAKAVILPAMVAGKTFKQVREAEALLGAGTDVSTVFEKTGIYPGLTDDIYRSVISDAGASLKYGEGLVERISKPNFNADPTERLFLSSNTPRTLGDILDHPELFSRAPELADLPVEASLGGFGGGSYSPARNKIFLQANSSEDKFLNVLLHEVQHGIQNKYGMTPGGNPGMFFDDRESFNRAKEVLKNVDESLYSKSPVHPSLATISTAQESLRAAQHKAEQNYLRIAGEAEARAVEQLRKNPDFAGSIPFDYYDINPAYAIHDPWQIEAVDADPTVKAIVDFVKRNPEFGKTKSSKPSSPRK
jgi:hypothetical protein